MNRSSLAIFPLTLVIFALVLPVTADAQELGFKVKNRVKKGEKPAVILNSSVDLRVAELVLRRQDGKKIKLKKKKLKAGETAFSFKQPMGAYSYEGKLIVTANDGRKAELQVTFSALVAGVTKIEIVHKKSSLQGRRVVLKSSAASATGDLELYVGDSVVHQDKIDLKGAKPGSELVFSWPDLPSPPTKILIKVHDPYGRWIGQEIRPFSVEIPHEEVIFDSGKASFDESEAKKLDHTLKQIRMELAKHGDALQLGLYVAGYTDSVGTAASNRGLSAQRARAIARYFRQHGLKIPVFCQGFGEDVLWVKTADNVDEPQNRRALYLLGNQAPPLSDHIPAARWKRVK